MYQLQMLSAINESSGFVWLKNYVCTRVLPLVNALMQSFAQTIMKYAGETAWNISFRLLKK